MCLSSSCQIMDLKPGYCEHCSKFQTDVEPDFDTVSVYFDAEDFDKTQEVESPDVFGVGLDSPDSPRCFFTLDSSDFEQQNEKNEDTEQLSPVDLISPTELLSLSPTVRDHRSNSFGVFEKKKLSPIVERKITTQVRSTENLKSSLDENDVEEEVVTKARRKIGIAGIARQSSKDRKALIDAASKSLNPSPNIEKMIKDLFIHKSTDEQSFKAIDPLEIERKISYEEKNYDFTKVPTRSKSYNDTGGRVGSLKNLFSPVVQRFLSRDVKVGKEYSHSSGSLDRRRAYSDNTYSESDSNLKLEFSTEEIDDDCFWNDICFTPRLDRQTRERQKDYRRNSSPEAFPDELKFTCLFKKNTKDKKDDNAKLEKKKSTPKLDRKNKGDRAAKLSRENSLSSPWGSRKGTPKLSRESSLTSPIGSKRGTPKLSRESSLASPMGSRKGTPKLSRESSFTSPFSSKKGTPKLSRESSVNSPKCTKSEQKMSKVTSMPQLENRKSTPKLERRKSTPKLRQRKESSHERVRKKMSDSELNKHKKELDLQLNRCTSTPELSRKRLLKSRSREKSFEGSNENKSNSVTKCEKRRSRKDTYSSESDEKFMIEKWLDHVSNFVGIFLSCCRQNIACEISF